MTAGDWLTSLERCRRHTLAVKVDFEELIKRRGQLIKSTLHPIHFQFTFVTQSKTLLPVPGFNNLPQSTMGP